MGSAELNRAVPNLIVHYFDGLALHRHATRANHAHCEARLQFLDWFLNSINSSLCVSITSFLVPSPGGNYVLCPSSSPARMDLASKCRGHVEFSDRRGSGQDARSAIRVSHAIFHSESKRGVSAKCIRGRGPRWLGGMV